MTLQDEPAEHASAGPSWGFPAACGILAVIGAAAIGWSMGIDPAAPTADQPHRALELSLPSRHDYLAAATESRRIDLKIFGLKNDLDWLATSSSTPWSPLAGPQLSWRDERPGPLPSSSPTPDWLFVASPLAQVDPDHQDAGPGPVAQQMTPATRSSEANKRLAGDQKPEPSRSGAAKSHKLAARPSYMEKTVEQGDAGDVAFRYRRRNCTTPNMVDVCFMPPENRRNIVVERY